MCCRIMRRICAWCGKELMRGEGPEDDVLQGLVRLERIPRTGERLRLVSHELEDVRLWAERPVAALARLGNQGRTLAYWAPGSRKWSDPYLNLPAIFVPYPNQTIHPIGKGLIVGLLLEPASGAFFAGIEMVMGNPIAVPFALLMWGAGSYLVACWYNLVLTPVGW